MHRRQHWTRLGLCAVAMLLLPGGLMAQNGAAPTDSSTAEKRTERRIAGQLEAGQAEAARVEAEAAIKRYPSDAALWRLLAQAHFDLATGSEQQFQAARDGANLAYFIRQDVAALYTGIEPLPQRTAQQRADFEKFRIYASGPVTLQFEEQAERKWKESEPLLQQCSDLLVQARADLKEARRLADTGTELELTELWCQTLPLLWRSELSRSQRPGTPLLAGADKALAPFAATTPDSVLRAAAEMAKKSPSDPAALAGAADVISVVAGIAGKADPLLDHTKALLDRTYLKGNYSPAVTTTARETARQQYLSARDAREPDPVKSPAALALQLYGRALQQDTGWTLPYLRLRLYLLRIAFDPAAAHPLLDEIRRHEPRNAAVPLEQAREAFLLDDKPADGMNYLREAARLPDFARSYLVAAPAPLRPALKYERALRDWTKKGWPGYGWLFTSLYHLQSGQQDTAPMMEVRLLRLNLADRLCEAPDYDDQAAAISEKSSALSELADLGKKGVIPREQAATVELQQQAHQRRFADFPRTLSLVYVTTKGLVLVHYPEFSEPHDLGPAGAPRLLVTALGDALFGF